MTVRFLLAAALILCPALVASASEASEATSPYIRMHAEDPIRWQVWDEATLARARDENKLILVSVGYASCHWCLTMAERTFRDPEVAAVVNQAYIPILVDREERPDLDAWFMRLKLAMDGQGGWPLNLFLTPDLVPLFGANFLPPRPERGQPGFLAVARGLSSAWAAREDRLMADIEDIRSQMAQIAGESAATGGGDGDPRPAAVSAWTRDFDPAHGGFGRGAKFPRPEVLTLLLREGVRRRDESLVAKVAATLDAMAAGAIRDQLSGLFHRYTADRYWLEPHFEITLADNAQLASLYLEAYRATGQQRHAVVAEGILEGLKAALELPGGGFASGLAADNAVGEGRFHTWTRGEIRRTLGAGAEAFIAAYMGPGDEGVRMPLRVVDATAAAEQSAGRRALRKARDARPPVPRDDKLVTSWNAMAASAFAQAARILDRPGHLETAGTIVAAILPGGRVAGHSSLRGRSRGEVFLDDYAFTVLALLEMYRADFDGRHLAVAAGLARDMLVRFQPAGGEPPRLTPVTTGGAIPPLTVLDEDGAPSGVAAALAGLRQLAAFGAGDPIQREAGAIADGLAARFRTLPAGLASAWSFGSDGSLHVAVVGRRADPATKALLAEVERLAVAGTTVALIDPEQAPALDWTGLIPRPLVDGQPAAYVCTNGVCKFPVTDPGQLADLMIPRVP